MEKEKINTQIDNNEEIEIDLLELFAAWKQRIWAILAATLVGGLLVGGFSYFVLTPQFTSTAMVYILSKETTLTSLADLQIGSQLTQDYKVIVTSRPVLEDVSSQLELGITYKQLAKKLTIDNPTNTRILTITAEDPDPLMAKRIADAVAETSGQYIGDIMEMVPPKLIESGEIPTEKSSPSNGRNALLGALAGLVLSCGIISLNVILNDTVQTEEDVAKYLELSILASVPQRKDEIEEDKEAMAKNQSSQTGRTRKKKRRA